MFAVPAPAYHLLARQLWSKMLTRTPLEKNTKAWLSNKTNIFDSTLDRTVVGGTGIEPVTSRV